MLRHPALFCSAALFLLLAIDVVAADGITATGVIVPDRRVTLSARISGRIIDIPVEAGDAVKAGQLLVTMDDTELQAELAKAGASAALATVEIEHTQRVDSRLQRLFKTKSVSEDALDEARYSAEAAVQQLHIAEAEVASIGAQLRRARARAGPGRRANGLAHPCRFSK